MITLAASTAASQPRPSWSLRWDAPSTCPGAAAVRARVATLVGVDGQREGRVQWDVTVRVDGTGYAASVRAVDEGVATAQTLTAPRCDELAETAALLFAWTVQPEGVAPPRPPPPPAPAARPPPAPSARATSPPLRWRVDVGLRTDVGLSPGVSFGPFVAVELGGTRWLARVDAAWLPPQDALVDARRGGRFVGWTAALSACARWGEGRWRGGPCAGVEAGAVHAVGVGVSDPAEVWEPWIAARAGGVLEVALAGRLRAVASLAARVPLRRAAFVLDGVGPVQQATALGVVGDLALGVTF